MTGRVLSGDDLKAVLEQAQEREADLAKMVYVEDGHIVIKVNYEYNIALGRCDTHAKIVAWVLHLSQKTWMTQDVLIRFIRLAMQQHGLTAPMP